MSELLPDAAEAQAQEARDFLERTFHPPTGMTWLGEDVATLPRAVLIEIIRVLANK